MLLLPTPQVARERDVLDFGVCECLHERRYVRAVLIWGPSAKVADDSWEPSTPEEVGVAIIANPPMLPRAAGPPVRRVLVVNRPNRCGVKVLLGKADAHRLVPVEVGQVAGVPWSRG